jgi:hypothetical protein
MATLPGYIVDQLKAQRYDTNQQNWYRLYMIVNRIQTMRADAATRGVDISFELADIRWSIISTVAGRDQDSANWLIRGVNTLIGKSGNTWVRCLPREL